MSSRDQPFSDHTSVFWGHHRLLVEQLAGIPVQRQLGLQHRDTFVRCGHAIQSRTGLSISKVVKQPRPLRIATININGATHTFPPAIPEAQREILTSLGVKPGY
jgi:hypothetical protein